MPNKNRDKLNQPPTGEGKKQSPRSGAETKLDKRSEVLQATNAEQNIGTDEDEASQGEDFGASPQRPESRSLTARIAWSAYPLPANRGVLVGSGRAGRASSIST